MSQLSQSTPRAVHAQLPARDPADRIGTEPNRQRGVCGPGADQLDDIMLERSYDGMQAYCQAKLADVMLTID
jgi:hypothetical protein